MYLYYYERKGFALLLVLIVCLLVLPRQFKTRQHRLFFLSVAEAIPDSLLTDIRRLQEPVIELNSADSSLLTTVKGIGPYYASRIVQYRKRLGGFHSVDQLKELKLTYLEVDSYKHRFSADAQKIRRMDLNKLAFKEVLRHPYLEYEDVQLIFNARRKFGSVSYEILRRNGILAEYKLRKIKPYIY